MARTSSSRKGKGILYIVFVFLLLALGIFGYWYINNKDNVSPTDSDAGVIKSCLSNVEELTPKGSCGEGKYRTANYKCYGGYTGKVGDPAKCLGTTSLREMAEKACVPHASCKMLKTAYSEIFTKETFNETNWISFNKDSNASYYFDNKGLNTKITNAKADSWHEIRLSDQNIHEDFFYELKGVDITNVNKAVATFAARGFDPGTVDWKVYGGPGNWNTMDIFIFVENGKKYINAQYKVKGKYTTMPKTVGIPTNTKSIDFRIYKLGKSIVAQYNIGSGYKTAHTYDNHNWVNNYVLFSSFAPKGTTTVGSYKSFTYKNVSTKFPLITRHSENFTKKSFSNKNWTVKQTHSNFKYKFSPKGIVFTNTSFTALSPELWSIMTYNKKTEGDVVVVAKNLSLSPTSPNGSKVFFTLNGYLYKNISNPNKWDQIYAHIIKKSGKFVVESGYSEEAHTKWTSGKSITLPKGVTTVTIRITRVASTTKVDVKYGAGYQNLLTIHSNNQLHNYTEFGIYNPKGMTTIGSLGGFTYKSR